MPGFCGDARRRPGLQLDRPGPLPFRLPVAHRTHDSGNSRPARRCCRLDDLDAAQSEAIQYLCFLPIALAQLANASLYWAPSSALALCLRSVRLLFKRWRRRWDIGLQRQPDALDDPGQDNALETRDPADQSRSIQGSAIRV